MTDHDLIVPPPSPKTVDYPATIGIGVAILFVALLLVIAGKFDPSHGTLTISLLIVVTFIGAVTFCMFFTVPQDETTASLVGGLTAAFGAVVAFWLNRRGSDPP
jgi:FtsH-binding integral membrane protein